MKGTTRPYTLYLRNGSWHEAAHMQVGLLQEAELMPGVDVAWRYGEMIEEVFGKGACDPLRLR